MLRRVITTAMGLVDARYGALSRLTGSCPQQDAAGGSPRRFLQEAGHGDPQAWHRLCRFGRSAARSPTRCAVPDCGP